jgi:hypothetical protein
VREYSSDDLYSLRKARSRLLLVSSRRMELPSGVCAMRQDLPQIILGETASFGSELSLYEPDLLRHLLLLGKTGVGKSTVLLNIAHQWIDQGGGMILLDPHGDLHAEILKRIPRKRRSEVLLIEPGEQSVGWNPLGQVEEKDRPRIAQEVVGALKAVFSDSWGPRLEYILYNAVRLVLDGENETLLGVQRVLTDSGYRRWLLEFCTDPVTQSFWVNEFNRWDARFQREAISSIQNKLGQCLSDPVLRAILGRRVSTFSPRNLMDEGKIVLVNLSKGALGATSSHLLGALLVSGFTSAAMSRQDIPEHERRTFVVIIDEFQNFTSDTFASLLSEARKYGLSLVCSNQFLTQLKDGTRASILGNTGSHILFRMGAEDAEIFHHEYGYVWEVSRFTGLASYTTVVRLLVDGEQDSPRVMKTLPPPPFGKDYSEEIRRMSEERFTQPTKGILEAQARWFRRTFRG